MKRIILLVFLFKSSLFIFNLSGQTTFAFTYDDSGNRTERTILLLKSVDITDTGQAIQKPEQEKEINENIDSHVIRIYPNPTKGLINIEILPTNDQKALIRTYKINGKMVMEKLISDQNTVIDLNDQVAGIYILNVIIGNKGKEWKIIKD